MRIKPEVIYYKDGIAQMYKCTNCNYKFRPIDMLSNKRVKGTIHYCPHCKIKFAFTNQI